MNNTFFRLINPETHFFEVNYCILAISFVIICITKIDHFAEPFCVNLKI